MTLSKVEEKFLNYKNFKKLKKGKLHILKDEEKTLKLKK